MDAPRNDDGQEIVLPAIATMAQVLDIPSSESPEQSILGKRSNGINFNTLIYLTLCG